MAKQIFFTTLMLLMVFAGRSQSPAPAENKVFSHKVDSFIKSFVTISSFTARHHDQVDDTTMKAFTDLFTSPTASVEDYANYGCFAKGNTDNTKPATSERNARAYAAMVRDSFPTGLKVKRLFSSTTGVENNGLSVKVIMGRKVKASTAGKQEIEFTDTLELSLEAPDTNYDFRISRIRIINGEQMVSYGPMIIKKASFYLRSYEGDRDPLTQKFLVSFGVSGGTFSQQYRDADFEANYKNAVNTDIGKPKFKSGSSFGFDLQLEYYLGESARLGVGTGLSYTYQQGHVALDKFHAEYQATDANARVYRQIVTAKEPIDEKLSMNSMNIPVLLKYKMPISARLGFMMDAGVLFNVFAQSSYTTNASFDYEAAYQFTSQGSAYVAVYDNQPTLNPNDWLITRQQYNAHNTSDQSVNQYFDQLAAEGYNVGLDKTTNSSSSVKYASGSVGFLLQPSVSFKLTENIYLVFGIYYSVQNFSIVSNDKDYMLTNKVGEYNSILNAAGKSNNSSFGIHLGAKIW